MKIKKLIKQVKWQVQECIDCDGDKECFMDLAGWKAEMGILLTPNEALQLINEIETSQKLIKDYIKNKKQENLNKEYTTLVKEHKNE